MSLASDKKIIEKVASFASSASAMALEESRAENIRLKTQLLLLEKKKEERARKKEEEKKKKEANNPNKILHDQIVKDTADTIDAIMNMDKQKDLAGYDFCYCHS